MQTRKESITEVVLNTATGYILALVAWRVLVRVYGIESDFKQSMEITAVFTVLSVIRGYVFRRVFNLVTCVRVYNNLKEGQK